MSKNSIKTYEKAENVLNKKQKTRVFKTKHTIFTPFLHRVYTVFTPSQKAKKNTKRTPNKAKINYTFTKRHFSLLPPQLASGRGRR